MDDLRTSPHHLFGVVSCRGYKLFQSTPILVLRALGCECSRPCPPSHCNFKAIPAALELRRSNEGSQARFVLSGSRSTCAVFFLYIEADSHRFDTDRITPARLLCDQLVKGSMIDSDVRGTNRGCGICWSSLVNCPRSQRLRSPGLVNLQRHIDRLWSCGRSRILGIILLE